MTTICIAFSAIAIFIATMSGPLLVLYKFRESLAQFVGESKLRIVLVIAGFVIAYGLLWVSLWTTGVVAFVSLSAF